MFDSGVEMYGGGKLENKVSQFIWSKFIWCFVAVLYFNKTFLRFNERSEPDPLCVSQCLPTDTYIQVDSCNGNCLLLMYVCIVTNATVCLDLATAIVIIARAYLLTGEDSWFPSAGKIGTPGNISDICATVSWRTFKFSSLVWFHTSCGGRSPVQRM